MSYIAGASLGQEVFVARGACLVGKVTVGDRTSVWYNAVLRGDEDRIDIGEGSNIQDNVVVHADHGFPCRIGRYTSIGHSAVIHGCRIGDRVIVGMGSVIMNGASVGNDCMIGAGSLVTGGTEIPDGMLAFGRPARVIRPLTDEEKEECMANASSYMHIAMSHAHLKPSGSR